MICVSLRQPLASMLAAGLINELFLGMRFDSEPTRVLIHAGMKVVPNKHIDPELRRIYDDARAKGILPAQDELPAGDIIAVADFLGVERVKEFSSRKWHWRFGSVTPLKQPIHVLAPNARFVYEPVDESNLGDLL